MRAIGYDQPDVYLTLKGLQVLGFAEKDASAKPPMRWDNELAY